MVGSENGDQQLCAKMSITNLLALIGVEYWQHDPPKPANVVVCNAEGEDASCSASVPSRGFNPAHLTVS